MPMIVLMCMLLHHIYCNEAAVTPNCDGVQINGQYYDTDILLDGIEIVGQLTIDKKNDLIFFSYLTIDGIAKSAYFNIETKQLNEIAEINGIMASAVDETNDIVYLAGDEGIYAFDVSRNKTEFYGLPATNIWSLYVWDKLYFTDYPNNDLYEYSSGKPILVEALKGISIKYAVKTIDGIYFVNSTGLYHATDNLDVTYVYSRDDAYRYIAKDKLDNVYVGRKETEIENEINIDVYKINVKEKNIEKVASMDSAVYSMVFDKNDNIILENSDKIVKLSVNKNECL